MLVVVCGVPGVGKTSVARYVAERADGTLLRTDVVRKDLFEDPTYSEEEGRRVYAELLERAERALEAGGVVVLDGTFKARAYREDALATAERAGVECRFIEVECDAAVAKERIRERADDESDATVDVHDTVREAYEPLAVDCATVDNSGTLAETRRQVEEVLGTLPAPAADGQTRQGPAP